MTHRQRDTDGVVRGLVFGGPVALAIWGLIIGGIVAVCALVGA